MNPEAAERRSGPAATLVLTGLIVLALALRSWRLGDWGFEGDEIFTLRDSLQPKLTNPRPLIYFLNHFLVRPLLPLDELGLRILPAAFGVLAIPVLFLVGRRLVGTRAALFGALLLAVSSLHIYQSQVARYWSLVFLLSSVYPFAFYVGFRERRRSALVLGLVTCVLAVLAHPVSVLLAGGVGMWLLATYLRPDYLAQLWSQRTSRWAALLLVILAGAVALRFFPMLRGWIEAHDTPRASEHLLHLPGAIGIKQVAFLMGYVEGLTFPLVVTGALGIYLLWQVRDRPLGLLLACLVIFPVSFIVLLSLRTAVSTTYLLSTAPVFFIGAGVLLDHVAGVDWQVRPRWLLPATLAAFIIVPGVPTLVSQYRDGRRHDFQGAARWLGERLEPGDAVFSDQASVLTHYLPDMQVERLVGDTLPLVQAVRDLRQSGRGGSVWIVAPERTGLRSNPKLGSLTRWIYDNCQLRNTLGVARLDFRRYQLQLYRCLAATPD